MAVRTRTRLLLAGIAALGIASVATPAVASNGGNGGGDQRGSDRRCARQFEQAQRTDMESFRDYDLPTWTAGHDDDAISIFAAGQWFQGRERISQVLAGHFANKEAVWSWTELTRAVDGCRTGVILYDATYAIPSRNFTQRAYVSVVYTYKHGRWLSVLDQSTLVPAGTPPPTS